MKNIFKKTAGIMIAISMLCALVVTGCNNNNTNSTDNNSTTETATQAVTEATTESSTSTPSKDIVTIKEFKEKNDGYFGVTVEGTDSNYNYLQITSLADLETEYDITNKCIKDILDIVMVSRVFTENDTIKNVTSTALNETVKVSIPYEEGVYVVHTVDGVSYDVDTEYIDGKYVFKTDKLGSFMLRTEPVGRTTPTKTTNLELTQQTMVDEVTGVQVTGMLPVGAQLVTTTNFIDDTTFYDRFDFPYAVKNDFPEFNDAEGFYIDAERKVDNIAKIINQKSWAEREVTAGGKIVTEIYFIKDSEILDFESDLTVTMPFNYRRGLITGGITDEAVVVQYDYDNEKFVDIEVVSEEDTAKGMFEFKAKSSGIFFLGGESQIDGLISFYNV